MDTILSRGEFATAYTPYQPEIFQGTLQTIYEYQSLLAELTGLPVVSASHYDGAAATAEAALMTIRATGRDRVLASRAIHRHYLETTETYFSDGRHASRSCRRWPTARPTWPRWRRRSPTPRGRSRACCWASPMRSASWSRWPQAARLTHAAGALFVAVVEPVSLAVLASPGEIGADIAVGEGQPLGIAPQYGGPYLGILAATEALTRQVPGRLVGRTLDVDGRRAYVMTLRAREQDIRRDRAASNICTNQALCALAATVYLATARAARPAGRGGRGRGGRGRLEAALAAVGVRGCTAAPTSTSSPCGCRMRRAVHAALLDAGVLAGLPLARWYPGGPGRSPTPCWCAPRRSPRTRTSSGSRRPSAARMAVAA